MARPRADAPTAAQDGDRGEISLWLRIGVLGHRNVRPDHPGLIDAIDAALAAVNHELAALRVPPTRVSLAAVSSALTLLSNAVMAWNTLHMQRALDAIEAIGGETMRPEDLRQIAPTHLEGINLRGTFDFPIARYVHRLLPNAASTPDPLSQRRTA